MFLLGKTILTGICIEISMDLKAFCGWYKYLIFLFSQLVIIDVFLLLHNFFRFAH